MRFVLAALLWGILLLPTAAAADDTVTVGLTPSLANAPYYVALAKGYLAAEHITPQPASFRGAQDAVAALAMGQLDISLGAINAGFFNAAHQGLDLRAVASLGIQPLPVTATPLVARKDLWDSGAIRSGADLRGRKVAANTPGASPENFLSLILGKYGMTLKDVDETFLGFGDMVVALHNKGVDAAFPAEPFATVAIRAGDAVLVKPDAGAGGGEMTTVFFFSGHFLRDQPAVGVRFLRAMIRGARDAQHYNKNPALIALLAKMTGISPANVAASVAYDFDPSLDIAKYVSSLGLQEKQHMKDGRLTYSQPLPMSQLVDATLVHKAAASLSQ